MTVRNGGGPEPDGGLGMWMASCQTFVLRDRFSMVVVFWKTNWRELPLMPRRKREKRAALRLR